MATRSIPSATAARSRADWLRPLVWTYAAAIAFIGATLGLALTAGVPLASLTRDPAALFKAPVYTGVISQLGLMGWTYAATVAIGCAALARRLPDQTDLARFLLASGLFSTWLLLDDMLLLHEVVLPQALGIPQTMVYGGYAGVTAAYVLAFRRPILRGPIVPLGLALLCFGGSIGIDAAADRFHWTMPGYAFVEDGLKFLGIVGWGLFFTIAGRRGLADLVAPGATGSTDAAARRAA